MGVGNMSNPAQRTPGNAAESATEAVNATTAETTVEEGASKHKIERAVAGIPDAISDQINKSKKGEPDPSKHRIERAVAGVPDALTTVKNKKLAEDAESRAAEGASKEGESEHKLEKIVAGAPDQLTALEDDVAEHVKPVIEQNSADAKARSHEIGAGAVMVVAAIVIAMFGIPVVLLGIAAALSLVLPMWASLLIVGAALLVIAGICTYSSKSHFSKAGEYDVSLKAGIRKSFVYFFKGIGMPDDMADQLRESK